LRLHLRLHSGQRSGHVLSVSSMRTPFVVD
jgi:hypothetical protein